MNKKYEDRSICEKCGGICCKKCGCDYFVTDFDSLKADYIVEVLNEGRTSIVAYLNFRRLKNGKLIADPFLAMRARNINRGPIDLLSFKTTCASLEENGCHYSLEERPSGGATLIPGENLSCHSEFDRLEELKKWGIYQKVLAKVVKRITGKNVDEQLKEDVENLFYTILSRDFDGISPLELLDVDDMLPSLKEAFPEELVKACIRFQMCGSPVLSRVKKDKK